MLFPLLRISYEILEYLLFWLDGNWMDSFAVSNVSSCLRFYWPLFFCLHDFPFVNPFWLPPVTFLSFLCLATVSRTISSTFQGIRVRLKSLWFPESFSLCLKIGVSLAFLSPQEPLPSAQAFASDWAWSHNDTGLPPSALVVASYQVPCSLFKGFLIWSSLRVSLFGSVLSCCS